MTEKYNKSIVNDSSGLYAYKGANFSLLTQRFFRINRRNVLKLLGITVTSVFAGCIQQDKGSTTQDENGTINVAPTDGLIDEPIEIILSDFEPNEEITVWAHTEDSLGQTWLSFGRFETDNDGGLAITEQEPISGTYNEADSTGLLWSMRVPDGPDELSYIEDKVYTICFSAQRNDTTVASVDATRRFIDPEVVERRIDENGLVGSFFEPPGSGPHPAVLTLHGAEGEIAWLLGAMLASHGYATLALQYFSHTGESRLPGSLGEIPLEYCESAISWLLDRPSVGGDHVGVVGASKGGELALLLGSKLSRIGVVVGYVPSGIVWQGFGDERSTWTYRGEDVPFVPVDVDFETVSNLIGAAIAGIRGRPVPMAWLFRASLNNLDSEYIEAATIPVEEIDGPVLLISGKDDGVWPSTELSEIALRRLESHDHPYPYRHLSYENAGHIISVPYQPTTYWDTFEFVPGLTLKTGGTTIGNAHAAADSWPQVLEFLATGLR